MRGKIAKEIRKEIYGKKNYRDRKYFVQTKTIKLPFLQKLASLFTKRKMKVMVGGIMADPLRRAYQQLKKDYKEMRHD